MSSICFVNWLKKYINYKSVPMKKLIILLLIIPIVSFGQNRSGLKLCLFLQQASPQFASTSIANNALDKILEVNNLKGEFVLVPCDQIRNVVAKTIFNFLSHFSIRRLIFF